MKATLKNYRQSPRKVRLLADVVRGKDIASALTTLRFLQKRAAAPVAKLIASAVANAKTSGVAVDRLYVKSIVVNKGTVLKRFMPRARGSASRILKRNSHVSIELGQK
jgi:large subunit ribosomal protein L22